MSLIDERIVNRFIADQQQAVTRVRPLDSREARRVIVVSPFVRFITYTVLDGCRVIAAHDRRHLEQAQRVAQAPDSRAWLRSPAAERIASAGEQTVQPLSTTHPSIAQAGNLHRSGLV